MSYRLWQEKYGLDPSVIGGVFEVDGKPFSVVGITPPGFFGDSLRSSPPDFFLPLNTEPYVQSDADLNKVDTHWLELIGRIQPGANAASIEAEMRVELKQWLRSHWSDMSANDRARFPEQRSEEHTSELQSQSNLVCRLLLEKKKHFALLT